MEFIDVVDNKCHYRIEFERRITVIIGDSGVGKTAFVEVVGVNGINTRTTSSREVVVAGRTNWQATLRGTYDSIVIFDDMEVVTSSEFSKLLTATTNNNNYIVIIAREDLYKLDQLSISISSYYVFEHDVSGFNHYTVPLYSKGVINQYEDFKPDIVIVEDSTGGFRWFKEFFGKIIQFRFILLTVKVIC